MPIDQRDVLELVYQLSREEDIKVTLTQSAKGAAMVAATTFIGGVLLGPLGLAGGAAVGGILVASSAKGNFRSVVTIIQDLPPEKRQQLLLNVQDIISSIDASDIAMVSLMMMNTPEIRSKIIDTIGHFVTQDLGYSLAA